jgi:hypothetical protein
MGDIRILTEKELPLCIEIASLRPRLGGSIPFQKDEFQTTYNRYFQEEDQTSFVLGYYDGDELVSFVCISFHHSNMRGRFWIIACLYTKRFKNIFTFSSPEIGRLIKAAFDFAEEREYYEYYYCTAERVSHVYERQWDKNPYQPIGRYEKILLYVIPPNTKPEFELSWRMMGSETKPDTMIFRKRVLKEQYRKKTA